MQVAFGSGLFYATPLIDAFGAAIANPTPILLGVLQDCSVDLSWDTKELHGQNQFAVDIGRGKAKIAVKAKSAQIVAAQLNALVFGQGVTDGQTKVYNDVTAGTPIPVTPFQITPDPPLTGTFSRDLGVRSATTGVAYTRVASSPTAGQYIFASGVYTFAVADEGKPVLIDYVYTLTTGKTIALANLPMGDIPQFRSDLYLTKNGKSTHVELFKCTTSKFAFATKQDDFTIPDYDMMGFANDAGQAYRLSTSE